jgi:hypothetical protein
VRELEAEVVLAGGGGAAGESGSRCKGNEMSAVHKCSQKVLGKKQGHFHTIAREAQGKTGVVMCTNLHCSQISIANNINDIADW